MAVLFHSCIVHSDVSQYFISPNNAQPICLKILKFALKYTGCPTRYRTPHFFNNSNTNEDTATKFEHEYVLFFHIEVSPPQIRCNILISGKIIKEMPGSVASGIPCTINAPTCFGLNKPSSGSLQSVLR
jgi:hypothetical protein